MSTTPAPAATDSTNRSTGINWALVAGVGTLLAASLTGALGVRRILQQRQRRAGQTIAQDAEPTSTEQTMAAAGEPSGVEPLDTVLRTLARHSAEDGRALPALRGAHLSKDDGVTLLLDEPAEPFPPFTAGPDTRTWILDPQATFASPEEPDDVQAPYPGLVTLGADDQGLLLADLTTYRVLLLAGTDDEILEVARALALELGTCRWTDYSEILTAGLGTRLAGLLPQGRIRTMPHLPAVAADLGELLLEAHQSGEQVLPWLLIAAGDHADTDVIQLADALSTARHLQTAVVLPATDSTRRAFPHAEILDTTRSEQTLAALLETPVTLQRVTDEQYREYVQRPAALHRGTGTCHGALGVQRGPQLGGRHEHTTHGPRHERRGHLGPRQPLPRPLRRNHPRTSHRTRPEPPAVPRPRPDRGRRLGGDRRGTVLPGAPSAGDRSEPRTGRPEQ